MKGTNGRTGSKDELTENSSNGNGEREAILEGEKHPVDEDGVSRWRDKLREEKEKINRGDYQSGAKRGAINNQRYIINENETTLFLTNLPDDASTLMLRNSFRHLPNMSDAFILRKKGRRGNIFGFIRFESVKNVDYLINEVKKLPTSTIAQETPLNVQPFLFPLPNRLDINSAPISPACHNDNEEEENVGDQNRENSVPSKGLTEEIEDTIKMGGTMGVNLEGFENQVIEEINGEGVHVGYQ
ncbi:hypothetical protein L1987_55238 [Smallanthus sonchifolius]|uniref:Uncharacterized protein n=1 Tax=Smallanthus sonchifolius TaxID=185202 RepID=A0ACB9E8V2_9ASTR|nr:hypothetical protein L1987_55238 [Smallanthus sonchifolius]